jgi:hypothetical protein
MTDLGSSKKYPQATNIGGGVFTRTNSVNTFSNWNYAYVKYCDGSRWGGEALNPVRYNNTSLYFRGKTNIEATVKDLLQNQGMSSATNVVLSGCSAGGEGTYYVLDIIRSIIPSKIDVKGLADAGWFLDSNSINGKPSSYVAALSGAYTMWNSSASLKQGCLDKFDSSSKWKCLYAMYLYPFITTPLFVYNSHADSMQLSSIFLLPCDSQFPKCNTTEQTALNGWVANYQKSIQQVIDSPRDGMFVDSCNVHCQSQDNSWFNTKINNQSPAQAFAQWYTQHQSSKFVDTCSFDCNPTCAA